MSRKYIIFLCLLLINFIDIKASNEDSLRRENIVKIRTLEPSNIRSIVRPVKFEFDGEEIHLNLIPAYRQVNAPNLPVFLVESFPGGTPNYTYHRVNHHLSNVQFYVDDAKKAVLSAYYDKGSQQILYDGLFGDSRNRHVLKSTPESRRKRFRQNAKQFVFRSTEVERNLDSIGILEDGRRVRPLDTKLDKPLETLYPKVMTIVDYHLYRSLGSNIEKTVKYVSTFWQAVDQKYIDFESPKVQVILTGIIIATDEKALNYVYQSRFEIQDRDPRDTEIYMDANAAFERMRMYFRYNFSSDLSFENYDAAILLTSLNTGSVAGLTMHGKICGIWYNDAVVNDDGQYGGVRVAAHELGHMLNLHHDTGSECSMKNGEEEASIMAPATIGTGHLYWSECSKRTMHEFSQLRASRCLEKPYRKREYDEDEWW